MEPYMSENRKMIALSVILLVFFIIQVVGFASPEWLYTTYETSTINMGLFQICVDTVCYSYFTHVGFHTSYFILMSLNLVGSVAILAASILSFVAVFRKNHRQDLRRILSSAFVAAAVILASVVWYALQFYAYYTDSYVALTVMYLDISLGHSFYFCTLSGVGSLVVGIVACVLVQRAPPDTSGVVVVSDRHQLISVNHTVAQQPMNPPVFASPQVSVPPSAYASPQFPASSPAYASPQVTVPPPDYVPQQVFASSQYTGSPQQGFDDLQKY